MKKLIILVGFAFLVSCASGSGGGMGYADLQSAHAPYINDSPSNPLGNGSGGFGN